MIKGIGTSNGIGIGKALLVVENEITFEKYHVDNEENEIKRLDKADNTFINDIKKAYEKAKVSIGDKDAEIILAQNAIIQDPELRKEIQNIIKNEKINAEYAFSKVVDNYINLFENMDDPLLKARASDFKDLKNRFLRILLNLHQVDLSKAEKGTVLVGFDITPSQTASLNKENISGIVIETGTEFSHVAILSKSLGIPSVVGAKNITKKASDGDEIIVDGSTGDVLINPDKKTSEKYTEKLKSEIILKKSFDKYIDLETKTKDGFKIDLAANLSLVSELDKLNEVKADGVGLFRTEFLYMDNSRIPTEDEQYKIYKKIALSMKDKPVIIRTLDVGGDKNIPYLGLEKEDNPFLGFRGIRYSLSNRSVFKDQLSALLRASAFGNIMIMLPLVISVEEITESRKILNVLKNEFNTKGIDYKKDIQLGIMVETPAAAINAELLAKHSDFFSLGTNDLVQYTLAVDRINKNVSYIYDAFHPAVLKNIYNTIKAANKQNIMVGICGQSAANADMVRFLIGCGINEISVPATNLLEIKKVILETNKSVWEKYANEIINLENSKQVLDYIHKKI